MASKGLTEEEIALVLNYDWDDSDQDEDLEDDEDIAKNLVDNGILNGIIELDEDVDNQGHIFEASAEESESIATKKVTSEFKWRKKDMEPLDTKWCSSIEPGDMLLETPLEYFEKFFDAELIQKISDETNIYCIQKTGNDLHCKPEEIKQYIGCLLYFGVLKIPQYRLAWTNEMRLPLVADVMPRNRFEKLKQFLHFNDNNSQKPKNSPDYDKLHKIRPLIDKLKSTYGRIPQEEFQAIDEQIIPFKGIFHLYIHTYLHRIFF